jgi:hypothetical protein
MHQTTVRFTPDLWEALEVECGRLGISAAQYLREAALARLSYTAGQRGDTGYGHALAAAGATAGPSSVSLALDSRGEQIAAAAATVAGDHKFLTAAVAAQSERARERARELRAQAEQMHRQRRGLETR